MANFWVQFRLTTKMCGGQIKDVATLQQKRICTVDQIVEASLEEGEGEGEGVVIVSIATSSGKRE